MFQTHFFPLSLPPGHYAIVPMQCKFATIQPFSSSREIRWHKRDKGNKHYVCPLIHVEGFQFQEGSLLNLAR